MIELRAPQLDDLECYFEIFSDDPTHHFIIDEGKRTIEQSLAKLKMLMALNRHEKRVYTIHAGKPVGFIVVHADGGPTPFISYAIRRSCWRKGYALEALTCLLQLESKNVEGLQAATHLDNQASQNLLLKAGFQKLGKRTLPIGERILFVKNSGSP